MIKNINKKIYIKLMVRIMATVIIKGEIYKIITKIAKRENISEDEVINKVLEKSLENESEVDIPDYLIANKDTYNPNPSKKELYSIAGIIDSPTEDFNIVKAVEDSSVRKWD